MKKKTEEKMSDIDALLGNDFDEEVVEPEVKATAEPEPVEETTEEVKTEDEVETKTETVNETEVVETEEEKPEEVEASTETTNETEAEDEYPSSILEQLNAMAEQNRRYRNTYGNFGESEKSTEEKPESTTPPAQTVETPRGTPLFKDQNEYEQALTSFDEMNKFLRQSQAAVFQMVADKLIPVIGNMIRDFIRNNEEVKGFYSENKDLEPVKNLVELEADEIRAKNPKLKYNEVMSEAGKAVRTRLGNYIKTVSKNGSAAPAKRRAFITPTSRPTRPAVKTKVNGDPQMDLINSLD